MDRRRVRGEDPIVSNMYHIMRLRRRVRQLQQQSNDLQHRMRTVMSDWRQNSAEYHELRTLTDGVEHQLEVQDALNVSLEEEIAQLRMLAGLQQQQQILSRNNVHSSTPEIQQLDGNQNVNQEQIPDGQVVTVEQNPGVQANDGQMKNENADENHNTDSSPNPENQIEAKE